ncbi:putative endonuclease LCL3 [Eremomyces bilateralis CBS 781.70]|uniref:Probable endonuclease LCL3 n=1 Tax=Eremomyces bilateralis CBS 781.70 TaxID=1392243 RepID=A0A6G1FTH3_9PEZI|nr:putative endonuclease LCL3 [Eremomyces bilateralis CBS 781.70]KAF1808961.1 putative endonuclease LCL3 [Eremomyces bilateralis CBS 781.70]
MRWFRSENDEEKKNNLSTAVNPPNTDSSPPPLHPTDWTHYTDPKTLLFGVLFTTTTLSLIGLYRRYLRRIPNAGYFPPDQFRKRSVFGKVTSVGDGDNVRIFHTPGGRLAGWGWLPGRIVPTKSRELSSKTIHIRLAGVDAPECAHFGRTAQPFGDEARRWLASYLLHRRVRAHVYRRDQYERLVGTVYVRRWFRRKDVGLEMLRRGLATVYEGKYGAEFGGEEGKYRGAEATAKARGIGLWKEPSVWKKMVGRAEKRETPMEFKKRTSPAAGQIRKDEHKQQVK